MKYFLIAGEASGDLHGADLMKELKRQDPPAVFEFLGGDLMSAVGGPALIHIRDMAFMGLLPVLMNLGAIRRNLSVARKNILRFRPDVIILIDYPGFNLRIAKWAKAQGLRTVYYISPKIWAWKTQRIKLIKAHIDQMLTIFPFETSFYERYNYPVEYVGNPLYDKIRAFTQPEEDTFAGFCQENSLDQRPIIALLPGSRVHEVAKLLRPMAETSQYFPEYQFVVAGFYGLNPDLYQPARDLGLNVVFQQTYRLLSHSRAALTASGTATLETALLKVPQVVCYKMSPEWLLETIRPLILKTRFFSLINLIAGKKVVTELFQSTVNAGNFKTELDLILNNADYRQTMLDQYQVIAQMLHTEGAAARAARSIIEPLNRTTHEQPV